MGNIISVKGLTKLFKVHYREKAGFVSAIGSVFNRKYKIVTALDNIHFSIQKGEIHALLGPNGAGKSTFIKILSGILLPTDGEVSVMGYVPWKEREQYVKNIGVLFGQKGQLTWELPAMDSYRILKEIYKIPPRKFKESLDYLVDLFQLNEIIKKPVRTLSLGERMKCEFISTLLHEPKLVFLDEPTLGMDFMTKDFVRDYVKRLNRELGTTFILTSHDLNEIVNLCKQITIINYGKIVFDNSIEYLRIHYSNKKVIEMKFTKELTRQEVSQFSINMTGSLTGTIEMANDNHEFKSAITKIVNNLPVHDINIFENSIESIIKEIYQA